MLKTAFSSSKFNLVHFRFLKCFSLIKPQALIPLRYCDSNNPLQPLIALRIYGFRHRYLCPGWSLLKSPWTCHLLASGKESWISGLFHHPYLGFFFQSSLETQNYFICIGSMTTPVCISSVHIVGEKEMKKYLQDLNLHSDSLIHWFIHLFIHEEMVKYNNSNY